MTISDVVRRRTRSSLATDAESAPVTRVAADETLPVSMTVNGSRVTVDVPPRLTLADALRDRLGLTGTHLGCEHGVCGMCTVLVDGDATRACLLFACQLDGSEIVTVEGLGRADDLHPLQASFGRHHALQCGFCTPGFLMSSYDLLTDKPEVSRGDLPGELSGVLCRCTGYRNIVDAVDEVARSHRDAVPGPRNCGPATLVGRDSVGAPTQATEDRHTDDAASTSARPDEIRLPAGEPTVTSQVTSDLEVPSADVWRVVDDTPLMARCLPGAELTEDLGDEWFRGRARVALGPVLLSFSGVAHVVERDSDAGRLRILAQGSDSGGGRVQADILLQIAELPTGSRLSADAKLHLVGRIAQFGRSLADDVSTQMFQQFSAAVSDAASGRQPNPAAAAPSALRLALTVVRQRIRTIRRPRRGRRRH